MDSSEPRDTAPTSGSEDMVEAILAECARAADGEVTRHVEVACERHPELADQLRARLRLLESGFPQRIPDHIAGFRLLRRLGAGGMGVVYLAEEEALGRTVALKLIRPEHLYFPDSLARFRREAKAVAALSHPGIVPVFSVGDAEGIPWFAMEYVAGANLQQVVVLLHGRQPERLTAGDFAAAVRELSPAGAATDTSDSTRLFGTSWQEVCLRIAVAAADALEHVHAHGILHRDLKPSNLMVTPSGRVMLVDFGLAATGAADRVTRTGSQAGSLLYMSPEQLAGKVAELDARTDVYSLGVTLWELLTLASPFASGELEDTRRRIELGDVPPMRERNRAVTWDAETVCLAAMERDPARRYPSARAFADDLRNVLEFRPIRARRPGTVRRVVGFARRRPAVAVSVAFAGSLLVGGPSAWALFERDAAARVREQRQRAEANLEEAFRAVHQMLTRVATSRLRFVPESTGLRRELLQDAVQFCDRLLAEQPSHPGIRREMANVLVQVGTLQRGMGDRAEAERSVAEAIRQYEGLLQASAGEQRRLDVLGLAGAEYVMCDLATRAQQWQQTEQWAQRAVGRLRELEGEWPHDADIERAQGEVWSTLADGLLTKGDFAGAQRSATAAVEVLERAHRRVPDNTAAMRVLVFALFSLGDVRVHPEADQAEPLLRRAVELGEELVRRHPGDAEDLERLAVAQTKLCLALIALRRYPEAEQLGRAAAASRAQLADDYPRMAHFHAELGGVLGNLSLVCMRQGDHEGALEANQRAVTAQQRALALDPDSDQALLFLTIHRSNIARSLFELDRWQELWDLASSLDDAEVEGAERLRLQAYLLCYAMRSCDQASELPDAERDRRREEAGSRAVACLRRAAAAGLDPQRLRGGSMSMLEGRADYADLLAEVDAGRR